MRGMIRKVASWLGLRPSPEPLRGHAVGAFVGHNGSNTNALGEARRLLRLRRDCIRRARRARRHLNFRESDRLYWDSRKLRREARQVLSDAGLSATKPWRTVARRGR